MDRRPLNAVMIFSGAVAGMAWVGFLVDDIATGAVQWLPAHVVGLLGALGVLMANIHLWRLHGADRQADPKVHSNTDAGTAGGAGGTTSAGEIATIRPRKRTVERAGIVIGEVIAYRSWRVAGDYLLSMNGVAWLPEVPMDGAGIDIHNRCGVHAFKKLEDARTFIVPDWICAIGEVRLWGTIVEHEMGYRGEKAKVHRIIDLTLDGKRTDLPKIALRIAERYSLSEKINV